jgi:hypothetical protein
MLKVPDRFAGKTAVCPDCRYPVKVPPLPKPEDVEEIGLADEEAAPVRRPTSDADGAGPSSA